MSDDEIRKQTAVRRLRGRITFETDSTLDEKRQPRTLISHAKSTAARLRKSKKR